MALEFRKKIFHKPKKATQYIIAFTMLLLALCLLFFWIFIRYKFEQMPAADSSTDSSAVSDSLYAAEDKANLLVIYNGNDITRFILLQADPAQKRIHITGIPRDITVDDGMTLSTVYQKSGAALVTDLLSSSLELPIHHYVAITEDKAETWFGRLESGLPYTLPEKIEHTENDITTTLSAGKHTLSATQAVTVLNHTAWQDSTLNDRVGAEIIAAMLDAYMKHGRNLQTDFSYLANLTQTSLRIGDFNDQKEKLTYLAEQNSGDLCQVLTLPISADKNGYIFPDTDKFKKSAFYK